MAGTGSILHIVPLNTGGVDRYVRDFCAVRRQDDILHVGGVNVVLERVAHREHWIASSHVDAIASFYKSRGLPRAVYSHSTLEPVRSVVRAISAAFGVPYVLSLHDVDFIADDVAASEREDRHAFVLGAYTRIAPSEFIAREARNVLGVESIVVENGYRARAADVPETADVIEVPGSFDIAVVGALGEHKGLSFLRAVASCLPANLRILHVGYSDGKLGEGWLVDQRVWSTGGFEPDQLPKLLQSAAVRVAFFPNRQPESFSYALSDVWLAGVPAVVPNAGALADRVRTTGAGWLYDVGASESDVARFLTDRLGDTCLKTNEVRAAGANLARVERTVYAVMRCFPPLPDPETQRDAREVLLEDVLTTEVDWSVASQLDTQLMRNEIRKLLGELEFAETTRSNLENAYRELTVNYDGRGDWISRLEKELAAVSAAMNSELANRASEIERLAASLTNEHAESVRLQEKYEADIATLRLVIHRYESAIERTPYPFRTLLRRWLNRK